MPTQNTLSTPDITPIQKLVAAVGGLLVSGMLLVNAFDIYDISGEQSAAVVGFWTTIGSVVVVADAVIRNGRARALAANPPAQAVDKAGEATIAG